MYRIEKERRIHIERQLSEKSMKSFSYGAHLRQSPLALLQSVIHLSLGFKIRKMSKYYLFSFLKSKRYIKSMPK